MGGDELSRGVFSFDDLGLSPRGWAKLNLRWPAVDWNADGAIKVDVLDQLVRTSVAASATIGTSCTGGTIGDKYVDLNNDGVCDNLYFGSPSAPYPFGQVGTGPATPVDCSLSPTLCKPPYDAVTGVIFTTRAIGNSLNQNSSSLTELQKF